MVLANGHANGVVPQQNKEVSACQVVTGCVSTWVRYLHSYSCLFIACLGLCSTACIPQREAVRNGMHCPTSTAYYYHSGEAGKQSVVLAAALP